MSLFLSYINQYKVQDLIQALAQELLIADTKLVTRIKPFLPGNIKTIGFFYRDFTFIATFFFQKLFPPVNSLKQLRIITQPSFLTKGKIFWAKTRFLLFACSFQHSYFFFLQLLQISKKLFKNVFPIPGSFIIF